MSEKTPSIRLNMLMNVLLTLSSVIFPLITLPYVTRVLGTEGVGKVFFAQSVVTVLSAAAELGIPIYGIRACAKVRDSREELSKTACEIITINMISCAAVYIAFGVMLAAVSRFREERSLMIIMSSVVILNAVGAEWLYKALEKYTYITLRSLIFKTAALVFMFLSVKSPSDYMVYGAISIFAASASGMVNFINLHRHIDLSFKDLELRRHVPAMLMLFMMTAAVTVYTNLDTAFLGFIKGDAEAGIYGVAVRVKLVIVSITTAVSAVLLPRNSFYYGKGRMEEFDSLLSSALSGINAVTIPAACYFMLYAGECIDLLAGDSFSRAAVPMRVIMPAVVLIGISNIVGMQMLVPMGREADTARAACFGAAADVILNIILIPKYASAGAAFATLCAEALVMAYLIYRAGRIRGSVLRITGHDALIIAAAFAALVPGASAKMIHAGTFTLLSVSAVIYFGIYALILYVAWSKNGLLR